MHDTDFTVIMVATNPPSCSITQQGGSQRDRRKSPSSQAEKLWLPVSAHVRTLPYERILVLIDSLTSTSDCVHCCQKDAPGGMVKNDARYRLCLLRHGQRSWNK